jgi:hypothetical protein
MNIYVLGNSSSVISKGCEANKVSGEVQCESAVAKRFKEIRKKDSRFLDRGMSHAVLSLLFSRRYSPFFYLFDVGSERTSVVPLPVKQTSPKFVLHTPSPWVHQPHRATVCREHLQRPPETSRSSPMFAVPPTS